MRAISLYDNIKLPMDMNLLDLITKKYMQISYNEVKGLVLGGNKSMSDLLYSKINDEDKMQLSIDENEKNEFFGKIAIDYENFHPTANYPVTADQGWYHFKSWQIFGTEKIKSSDQLHRFYCGVTNDKMYEFTNVLYEKFKNQGIPFYFKTMRLNSGRVDNVVIYTSTKLLEKTIDVIDSIQIERPDLINTFREPSILVGKYSDKIGYAEEVPGISMSYTDCICTLFTRTLGQCLHEYAKNNPDSSIKLAYKNKVSAQFSKYGEPETEYSKEMAKQRILYSLLENDMGFKEFLLRNVRNNLSLAGIDPDNICFSNEVKKEVENLYGIQEQAKTY